jgi:hypothetical protein
LYSGNLLNLLILIVFSWSLYIFLCIKRYYLQTGNSTYFFPSYMPFLSFSCLISLAKTSSTISNKSSEEHSAWCGLWVCHMYPLLICSWILIFTPFFDVLLFLICIYWSILASLQWNQLSHHDDLFGVLLNSVC